MRALLLLLALLVAMPAGAATPAPAVGSSATYRWTSSIREDVPILIRQVGPGGQVSWSVTRESATPAPLFVTYAVVRSDARTYTLQVTTHETLDGPPLSVTQTRMDTASGKALRSVIRAPKGPVPTPEGALRPFRQADAKGPEETVSVPPGQFTAVRTSYRDGTVWVSDRVPALGVVKATFPSGTLELQRSGTSGAKDLLRS